MVSINLSCVPFFRNTAEKITIVEKNQHLLNNGGTRVANKGTWFHGNLPHSPHHHSVTESIAGFLSDERAVSVSYLEVMTIAVTKGEICY